LRDLRVAFGDVEEIRSADLVAKLTSDPERPWTEWKHGRPLSQRQLAGLLKSFCIISTTVHPHGAAHGKGYRRADFEAAWDSYCPGQNTLPAQSGTSEACKRASPDEMGTTRDFRSVREDTLHASKNGKLSHSHAALHGCTDRVAGNGGEGRIDQEVASAGDGLDIPDFLLRPAPQRCAHCGSMFGVMKPWDWPGRPDGIWLHPRCEEAWYEAESPSAGRASDIALGRGNGRNEGAFLDEPDDCLDLPPNLRRCLHCNSAGEVNAVALPDRTVWLHRECEAAWLRSAGDTNAK
jgi:hypothetical protein